MPGLEKETSETRPLAVNQPIAAGSQALLCLDCSINDIAFSTSKVDPETFELFLASLNSALWQALYPQIDNRFNNTNYIMQDEKIKQRQLKNGIILQIRIHITIKEQTDSLILQANQEFVLNILLTQVENFMERVAEEKAIIFRRIGATVWFAESPQPGIVDSKLIWEAQPLPGLTKSSSEALFEIRKRKKEEEVRNDTPYEPEVKKQKIEKNNSSSTALNSPAMFRSLPSSPGNESESVTDNILKPM